MGYDRPPREMHDATCGDCGKDCQVPFEPRNDKPVYCNDCFQDHKPARDDRGGGRFGRGGGEDMVEIETVDAEQADMVEIAAAEEEDMVETDLQEKCTKQLVEIAVTNVKYHSNQAETNQFIVTIASKITNQQETTVDAEDISHFQA